MQNFDAFAKPMQEFQVKTKIGGYISITTVVVILYLMVSEIFFFMEVDQKDEMVVDLAQDHQMLDETIILTLPDLPCSIVGMNVVHSKNSENVMHVSHKIIKTRFVWDKATQTKKNIGTPIRAGLHKIAASAGEFSDHLAANFEPETMGHANKRARCMSCYQSTADEDDCCNTCDEVKNAFAAKKWKMATDHAVEQCQDETYKSFPVQEEEGCMLEISLQKKKVPAIIQIGMMSDFNKDLLPKTFAAKAAQGYISFTHRVEKMRFGPEFPGFIPVLDGLEQKHEHVPLIESWGDQKMESQSEHWQYELHLIPTDYQSPMGRVTESHQYSTTHYVKGLNVKQRHRDLPPAGIFFRYEFTAFKVKWKLSYKSFTHFLTNVCAILGGIYAFFGMLDNILYTVSKGMTRSAARKAAGGHAGGSTALAGGVYDQDL